MSILSQLQNSQPALPHSVQGFFGDDRLYRYLNVYPLKGLCEGSLIHSNHHADRIPPIHRLPVELLAEIFKHYLQIVDRSQPSLSLCIRPRSQVTPFRLGWVCYYWRSIVLAMGDLWQSMFIGPPKINNIPLIRLWLSLAGERPLTLWLVQSDCPSDSEIDATNEILPLLVNRLHRWKAINFDFSVGPHQAWLNLPHGAAVSLESARIDVRDWDHASADNIWRALHSSPTLCRPDWVTCHWRESVDHVPWGQLTHIKLEGWHPVDAIMRILPFCQSVVTLSLLVVRPDSLFETPLFPLPNLKAMSLITGIDLGIVFQSLVLPGLVSLDINLQLPADIQQSSFPLVDLICRSQCQLAKLTLRGLDPNICEDRLLDYLRIPTLRSLVELRLYNTVTDKTIRLLSTLTGKEQLLPKLQEITIGCCTSDGLFSDMVVSRLPTLRIIHVTFRCDGHPYRRDQAMLCDIRNAGCDVQVSVF
jgi:hypothetical protein